MTNPTEPIQQLHQLYCHLTGQPLPLRMDRLRLWHDLLQLGYGPSEVRQVIRYLQREIRAGRRYIGALKLSNLLQPDRFEEDLHLSGVRLTPGAPPPPPPAPPDPRLQEERRQHALQALRQLRAQLFNRSADQLEQKPTTQSAQPALFTTDQSDKNPTK